MTDIPLLEPLKQAADIADRLRNNDNTFFRLFNHPINYNEWHNVAMGVIGYPLGRSKQYTATTLIALAVLVLPELPEGEDTYQGGYRPPIGIRTLSREPWYFIASLLATFLLGLSHAD